MERHTDRRSEQMEAAEALALRLDRPMGYLGVLFLFVILGQLLIEEPGWVRFLGITAWVFWALFVAEFLLRAYVAGFQAAFWRRNWWQLIFLAIPFLRFVRSLQAFRVLRVARFARVGGILSAGVRGSRSAGRLLSSRIGWLAAVTVVVVLAVYSVVVFAGLAGALGAYFLRDQAVAQTAAQSATGPAGSP